MKTFSIRAAYRKSWELWKAYWKLMVSTAAVFIMLNWLISQEDWEVKSHTIWFVGLIIAIIDGLLYMGWIKLLLKVHDGVPTKFSEIFQHAHLFWKVMGMTIIFGVIVIMGLFLLIIPGIYFYLKYQFAALAVIDRPKIPIKEAFYESARITEGLKWKLLGFTLINFLVIIVGAITVIGELLTLPLATLAMIYTYRHLHVRKDAGEGQVLHSSVA